jgi:hypothetical protein
VDFLSLIVTRNRDDNLAILANRRTNAPGDNSQLIAGFANVLCQPGKIAASAEQKQAGQ